MPGAHCRYFFGLLGGGQPDSGWNRSGMTPHRLAILPGVTNYDLNVSPNPRRGGNPLLDQTRPVDLDICCLKSHHGLRQLREAGTTDNCFAIVPGLALVLLSDPRAAVPEREY